MTPRVSFLIFRHAHWSNGLSDNVPIRAQNALFHAGMSVMII